MATDYILHGGKRLRVQVLTEENGTSRVRSASSGKVIPVASEEVQHVEDVFLSLKMLS